MSYTKKNNFTYLITKVIVDKRVGFGVNCPFKNDSFFADDILYCAQLDWKYQVYVFII